jgi:uncharacterized protein
LRRCRYGLTVLVVANSPIVVPRARKIERVVVGAGRDAADDWIAERAGPGAIVLRSDIPLASRCVKSGADVIAPQRRRFSESSIGMALATRDLMDHLRSTTPSCGYRNLLSKLRTYSGYPSAIFKTGASA